MKHSLSLREILSAEPTGFPEGSGYISLHRITFMQGTLFILRAETTLCRLPLVAHQNPRSSYCSTLVFHSTSLEKQRTLAVDSIDSGVPQVVVCRGSTQKKGGGIYFTVHSLGSIQANGKEINEGIIRIFFLKIDIHRRLWQHC